MRHPDIALFHITAFHRAPRDLVRAFFAIALARMRRALDEYVVTGIRTNLAFHQKLITHPAFAAGQYDTGFIDRYKDELLGYASVSDADEAAFAAAIALAVHRDARAGRGATELISERQDATSPWVMTHRTRALRS